MMMNATRQAMMMPRIMKNRSGPAWLLGLSGEATGGSGDAEGSSGVVSGGSMDVQMQNVARW